MKTVVLAFEDQYYPELFALIKRLRRDRGLEGMALFGTSVRGTGGFINEVPTLLRIPPGQANVLPDLVVCLADADRPGNLMPGASNAPITDDGRTLDEWVLQFEGAWREYLLQTARISPQDHVRVTTVCLRWSKESLLVASPDALLEHVVEALEEQQAEDVVLEVRRVDGAAQDVGGLPEPGFEGVELEFVAGEFTQDRKSVV